MKRKIIIGVLVALIALTVAVAADAATGSKQIAATYRNILIMVNGNVVTAEPGMGEPFIVDSEGRTYVPIRLAAEALGMQVEWVDWLNAVKITGSTSSAELDALKAENESLKAQLAAYQDDEDDDDTDTDLSDLEDDLNSDFNDLEDVAIEDISLSGDEDDVDVDVEVDLDDYADEWEELTDSQIKNWIADLVGDIQDALSDDTYVSGKIIDIDSDDTLVKFTKNGDSSLSVTYYDDDYRGGGGDADDVIDALEDEEYSVSGVDFTVDSVTYNESNDRVTVTLYMNDDDDWDEDEDDIISIGEDIAEAFEDEDIDIETVRMLFYDDDNALIDTFNFDVSSGDLE